MFINKDFFDSKNIHEGSFIVESPSNIALIKYWGKYGVQLPCNPSISITLNNAKTIAKISFERKNKSDDKLDLDFYFEGSHNEKFREKIEKFFLDMKDFFPFVFDFKFRIDSSNTFPHSSGIASSASSMSAFASSLVEIEKRLSESQYGDEYYVSKASFAARIGSGSACRSLYPKMAVWGDSQDVDASTNDFAVIYKDFDLKFEGIKDSIAIVSAKEKAVSSRAGHALMNNHPFREVRFSNARKNLHDLLMALREGDFEAFTNIVESEALELHGLMMNSNPSFILMEPNTLEIIFKIRKYRNETGHPICFTLDAGPNVHILYLKSHESEILKFLESDIRPLCANQIIIHDEMGMGTNVKNS